MILVWFFLMVFMIIGVAILQIILTKDEPVSPHHLDDSQVEPWEGY